MKNILCTALGSFSTKTVIEGLEKKGYTVYGADCYPGEWIPMAKRVKDFAQIPLVREEEVYLDRILSLCKEWKLSAIFPLIDLEVDFYEKHKERFQKEGITLCIPKGDLSLIRDKYLLSKFLSDKLEEGFSVIPGEEYEDLDFENLSFPMIAKKRNGRSSEGLCEIEDEDQLGFFCNKMWREEEKNYIFQRKIEGKVYTVDYFRGHGGVDRALVRKENLRTKNGAGVSVEILPEKGIERQCKRIAEALNLYGLVNFEWIYEEQEDCFYFLEINPRPSGGIGFSVLAGAPFVEEAVAFYLSETSEPDAEGEKAAGGLSETKAMADFVSQKPEAGIRYGFYGKYYDDFYLS